MTERSFGQSLWYGEVVSVDDPDKEGRVQVRIHGLYDDKSNIPDKDLPWVKPCQDITSSGHNKIGTTPVGLIKGATVGGYFLDGDKQYPIYTHTIAKAGDADSGSTTGNQVNLKKGTNSTPIAERNKNNKFVTRKGRNIYDDDHGKENPKEQNDSDGVDVTDDAAQKTKFHKMPTVASELNPNGSILKQLTKVDPEHLTSVLKNSVPKFMKINDIDSFSSSSGVTGVLGQALGQVMSQLGATDIMNAIAQNVDPTQLSLTSQQALLIALQNLGPSPNSDVVLSVIGTAFQDILTELLNLIKNGLLNAATLEALLQEHFAKIQSNGSQQTIGANLGNILGMLGSVLPQLSGPINSSLSDHLPPSVLDQSIVQEALKKFAMSQAYLKKPETGKKALAISAVQQTTDTASILSSLSGLSTQAQTFIQGLTGTSVPTS